MLYAGCNRLKGKRVKRYVVIVPTGEIEQQFVGATFPDNYELLPGNVWVVGGQQPTCAEVCEVLGIGRGKCGVVTQMDDYYGFYDRALWEKANAWGAQP